MVAMNTFSKSNTSIPMTGPRDSAMIRIMVVEDNVDYRTVIALAIDDAPDMKLIGLFGTTEIALRTLETTRESEKPDILLLDLRLPGISGLDAIPLIHVAAPATRIIILSQSDEPSDIVRAISAGVSGYLLKSARLKEITEAIRTVSQGGGSLDKNVAQFILQKMTLK
jgi:DNA-binding NarL/FixJ family response regulator